MNKIWNASKWIKFDTKWDGSWITLTLRIASAINGITGWTQNPLVAPSSEGGETMDNGRIMEVTTELGGEFHGLCYKSCCCVVPRALARTVWPTHERAEWNDTRSVRGRPIFRFITFYSTYLNVASQSYPSQCIFWYLLPLNTVLT